jgi:hypothetical protein
MIVFIGHLEVGTTNNYNIIADFYTIQISAANAKSFPACSAFARRFLVTALTMAIHLLPFSSPL